MPASQSCLIFLYEALTVLYFSSIVLIFRLHQLFLCGEAECEDWQQTEVIAARTFKGFLISASL